MARKAIIIGAGPAGLTAGLEFLRRSDIVPVILEASNEIGFPTALDEAAATKFNFQFFDSELAPINLIAIGFDMITLRRHGVD